MTGIGAFTWEVIDDGFAEAIGDWKEILLISVFSMISEWYIRSKGQLIIDYVNLQMLPQLDWIEDEDWDSEDESDWEEEIEELE